MKIRHLFVSAVAFFGLLLVMWVPTSNASELNTQDLVKDLAKQVQYFDGNGNQIYPYTLEEIEKMFITPDELKEQSITPMAFHSQYNTGAFSFTNFIWISGGNTFYNLIDIQTTPSGTANAFTVEIYSNGNLAGEAYYPSGWVGEVHQSWSHLTRGKSYSIKYRNPSGISSINKFTNVGVTYD